MVAELLVMRRRVSHNELPTKKRCCLVSSDTGGSLAKTKDSAVACNAIQLQRSLVFCSFFCPVANATGCAHEQAKLGGKNRGRKTYGGENDSGRLQVHLTAPEAVKQTRYVNGPNCKRGGKM